MSTSSHTKEMCKEGIIFALPGNKREWKHSDSIGEHKDEFGIVANHLDGETKFHRFYPADTQLFHESLQLGDKVQFRITNNPPTDRGQTIVKIISRPTLIKGVIRTMKGSYGYIEREDVVEKLHFSLNQCIRDHSQIFEIGTEVEFEISAKTEGQPEDSACNIRALPKGTVVFNEIDPTTCSGVVKKTFERGGQMDDRFSGRILAGHEDIPFGDEDIVGTYTLLEGDSIEFKRAVDKRDRRKHATAIELKKRSPNENVEKGIIVKLEDDHGFIKSELPEWTPIQFFFSEIMSGGPKISEGDMAYFSYVATPSHRAIRLEIITKDKVSNRILGVFVKQPATEDGSIHGWVFYNGDYGTTQLPVYKHDIGNTVINAGDTVTFRVNIDNAESEDKAVDLSVVYPKCSLGYVVSLDEEKNGIVEWFGFDQQLPYKLQVHNIGIRKGDEVELSIQITNNKPKVRDIVQVSEIRHKLQVFGDIRQGVIVKMCKHGESCQEGDFLGEIQTKNEDGSSGTTVPFSFGCLLNKGADYQKGDEVLYVLGTFASTKLKAFYIVRLKDTRKGTIDSKGAKNGYIIDHKSLNKRYFTSTLTKNFADLQVGDEVEFVTVFNPLSYRFCAMIVKKCVGTKTEEDPSD